MTTSSGNLRVPRLDRRGFIRGGLGVVGVAALPLLGCGRQSGTDASDSDERIVIVGAGAAALAAANELRNQGFDNVVLLEARDRVGGRIWTSTLGDGIPVDLGATWIHGINANPVYDIAVQNNIPTARTDYRNQVVYDTSARELAQVPQELWSDYLELAYGAPDEDLLTIFEQFAAANDLGFEQRQRWRHLLNSMFEQEFGADLSDLSISSYEGGGVLSGGDVVFPGGYDQIVDVLAEGLDIRLGQAVGRISHTVDGATVETETGHVFEAARVIVTVPLGVLKEDVIVFDPVLPDEILRAVDALAMGDLNRTCLLFDEPFWDSEIEWIGIVGDAPGEWAETLNLYPYLGQPVLAMFNAGTFGAAVEQYSDEALTRMAVEGLGRVFGNVPDPVDSVSTRWRSDPWTRGSYSYVPAGGSFDSYRQLATPVNERLFLAGEATHAVYPSTVHGAMMSGTRAARQIAVLGN